MILCFPFISIFRLLTNVVGLVLLMLFLGSFVCRAEDYDVYLLAGQSNMDGRGKVRDLDDENRAPFDNAIIFYRNLPTSTDDWQPLGPGFSIPPKHKDGLPSPTFGPELGFAAAMLDVKPHRKLALIKGSKGGTSLRFDWKSGTQGDPSSQGPRYRDFVETIQIATEKLAQRGDTYTFRGLLWHQGESDSKSKTKVYQRRLETFIARIREDIGQLDLPVIVGEVFDNGKRDDVRAAIGAVASSDERVGLVESAGLTTWDPGTHFDAASQLELGKRYAQAALKLEAVANAAAVETETNVDSTEAIVNPNVATELSTGQTIGADD